MILIKTKQRELQESGIISQMLPLIKTGYAGKKLQPELKSALPLFLHNIVNTLVINDLISSDLLHTPYINDNLLEITDNFDNSSVIALLLQAFSDLDTKGKIFECSEGMLSNSRIDGQTETIRIDTHSIKASLVGELDSELERYCKIITTYLQNYIKDSKYIILHNITLMLSYDDKLAPSLILNMLMTKRVQHTEVLDDDIDDPDENTETLSAYGYADLHAEEPTEDFLERFGRVNLKTGEIEINGKVQLAYSKEFWFPSPDDSESPELELLIDEDDDYPEPNEALKNAAIRYLDNTKQQGEYQFRRPGQKRGSIPYDKKPSFIHRIFSKLLFGMEWVNYKNK